MAANATQLVPVSGQERTEPNYTHWARSRRIERIVRHKIMQIAKNESHKYHWEVLRYLDEQNHGRPAQRNVESSYKGNGNRFATAINNLFLSGTVIETAGKTIEAAQNKPLAPGAVDELVATGEELPPISPDEEQPGG